jgi:peroxiredoxin
MNIIARMKRCLPMAPWVMVAVISIINVLLIMQNFQMRAQLDKYKPNILQAGDKVRPFITRGLRGEFFTVDYTGTEPKRILFFFTPSCPYCQEQFAYWQEILNRVDQNQYQVLGVAAESEDETKLTEFLRSVNCESMNVALLPNSLLNAYKLSVTPTTLVIENNGKVEKVWAGSWKDDRVDDAGSYFGLQFSKR